MRIVPINTAEAVFEPFWDPELREMEQWSFKLSDEAGTRLIDWWCGYNFE